MTSTQQLQSTFRESGFIEISMAEMELSSPASDEVIVRIEATPINPSDLGTLTGPADMQTAENVEVNGKKILRAPVKEELRGGLSARVEKPLPIGNEGAGVVVEAMASGLPCIVVDAGGPGSLIQDDRGLKVSLAPRETMVGEFGEAMLALASDPQKTFELGTRALEYAEGFRWNHKNDHIEQVFRWVMGELDEKPEFY